MGFRGEGPPTPEMADWRAPDNEKPAEDPPKVPESEMNIEFVRSSGPGGQNVNKVASKAQLRWNVGASAVFSDEQKELIRAAAGNRLNKADEIVISSQVERSQVQNHAEVIARLQRLVAGALEPRKERKPTKPSSSQRQKRLDEKKRQGEKKERRQKNWEW